MLSSARRWIGTFRRASSKQEALRDVQDELDAAAEDDHSDGPADHVVQDMQRKGYTSGQVDEFFAASSPAALEPKKP